MPTISLRINDEDGKLIHDYVKVNNLNLSEFVRNAVLEKIEDEMEISEEFAKELLKAKEDAKKGKLYTLEEARKELGI